MCTLSIVKVTATLNNFIGLDLIYNLECRTTFKSLHRLLFSLRGGFPGTVSESREDINGFAWFVSRERKRLDKIFGSFFYCIYFYVCMECVAWDIRRSVCYYSNTYRLQCLNSVCIRLFGRTSMLDTVRKSCVKYDSFFIRIMYCACNSYYTNYFFDDQFQLTFLLV